MRAVLINRELNSKEQAFIDDKAAMGATVYRKGEFEISEEEKRQINYDTMDLVLAFGNREFSGKAVADWLQFDQSSLWYYHKFRAYFRLRNLRYEIATINKLARDSDKMVCYVSDPLLSRVEFPGNVKIILPDKKEKQKRNKATMLNFALILSSRWMLNLLSVRKLKKARHILMDVTKRQTFLDLKSLRQSRGNYVIGYMIDKAGKDIMVMDEAVQPKMTDGAKISLNRENLCGKGSRGNRYFGEPILLNYFLSGKTKKRKKELSRNINQGLRKLLKLSDGDEQLLIKILLSFRGATHYYVIKYLAYKRFFEKHYFKTISTVDENSPAMRSILDAARICGIKTIGIQHGNIHDLHPAYLYTPEDIRRNAVPDHTLIWGEFWKEFLIDKGKYPAEGLHISGQIRTDVIPGLIGSDISKDKLPGIDGSKKLIVFASQPQRDPELRKRAALDVMHAVKDIPEGFLFIKLHPNERNDIAYYQELADVVGLKNLKISLDVDLYLLISACDVLVTCFSTVGTETIYFNKPLVILDHLKQDIQNYHKEGVAIQASNKEELEMHLKEILGGKKQIDTEAYRQFVGKYAFAIDGKASERALQVIERLDDLPI